jgi:protein-tyrosine-phosphatase
VDLASSLGIPVPESRMVASLADAELAEEFPLVLKPVRSSAAVDGDVVILSAAIVRDERARRAALSALLAHGPVQQQRHVGGRGVGVEMLFDRGREVWHFVHERLHETPLTGGGSAYRRSVRPPSDLLAAARTLLHALEWHGVAMVEFKVRRDGSFHLMEVNPRFWGSLALAIDCGVNFPLGLWRIAAGLPPVPQPAYRVPYYTRSLPKDLEWLWANWRADHRDPLLLTRPRARSLIEYGRPLLGRESWDHWDVRDLGVIGASLARFAAVYGRRLTMWQERRRLTRQIVRRHVRLFGDETVDGRRVRRLLFVCHGNICRSPFAERLARMRLDRCSVESAGVRAEPGLRSPERLVRMARTMGVDLEDQRSTRVEAARVAWADLILVMDADNYALLAADFPEAVTKMTLLGLFAREARAVIPDPYTMSEGQVCDVLEQICEAVDGLSSWLQADPRMSGEARPNERSSQGLSAAVEAAVAGRLSNKTSRDRIDVRASTHPFPEADGDETCVG